MNSRLVTNFLNSLDKNSTDIFLTVYLSNLTTKSKDTSLSTVAFEVFLYLISFHKRSRISASKVCKVPQKYNDFNLFKSNYQSLVVEIRTWTVNHVSGSLPSSHKNNQMRPWVWEIIKQNLLSDEFLSKEINHWEQALPPRR